MKKRFFSLCLVLLLLASCLLAFSSCSEEELPTRTLHVYNWGQYISDGSYDLPDVNALFEEYFNEQLAEKYGYRIEVNYSTYPSNEDMYNKIASGSGSFDVIVPSEYMIEKMISENLLLELDFSKITNYEYIAEEFRTDFNTYDPEGKYTVPYTYGTVGLI